ncbi:cyclopropane-fatty-acyl-phospholipid synthase family protein [Stieleria sp. TO1_6]|uniref:SAM-dependent methyltransferase n=1 Tax=Stieleria tagensis TaxID=2956795 RepID=UPI00209B5F30|nr:cyclopropane-fatty-acyl-phospholipid synthase family protein [Stieleria tagensis]MCO8122053.1 cyclopropane-fatty-acyl-phospholipid synthase family protein [Stieleria tagensis]
MGQTNELDHATVRPSGSSFFSSLLDQAEQGRLPDWIVRLGIRRLLRTRLRELQSTPPQSAAERLRDQIRSQPIAVATHHANEQHYELPTEFFQQILGPHLKYSCCYWDADTKTLDDAERNALRMTAEHAQIENGMDVLELGCGWGSLSLWLAQAFPDSSITSISNSHTQRRFITAHAQRLGLRNLDVQTADINDFQTDRTFDRVVSVEMFEHVRNHVALLSQINRWLTPEGKLLVHVFCHRTTPYLFETDGSQDWMGRHFFTGGMMPSVDWLSSCSSSLTPAEQWTWDGTHYAKTCRAWLSNQDAATETLRPILAKTYGRPDANRWHHRWRMFFMACEELFATRGGREWFVSHTLFQK